MDAVFLLEHGLRMYSVATSWLLSEGLLTGIVNNPANEIQAERQTAKNDRNNLSCFTRKRNKTQRIKQQLNKNYKTVKTS